MNQRKRGLGRGLDALLGDELDNTSAAPPEEGSDLRDIPIDLLEPYQSRRDFDQEALQELADSIKAQGVVQPLVVRPSSGSNYQIIAGERRWRAAQIAHSETVPALVRTISDEAAVAVGLIENLQREDLNPLEAAGALNRLIHDFGFSHQKTAEAVGRSRTAVTNLLRLLELNDDVQELISAGYLETGHAKALAGLPGTAQSEAAARVARDRLTVRQAEALARRYQEAEPASPADKPEAGKSSQLDPDVARLRDTLAERLGAPVDIEHSRRRGKGRLVIRYSSLEELDGILGRIR